jgi:hypothetical protein
LPSVISNLLSVTTNVALASDFVVTPNAIDIESYGVRMPLVSLKGNPLHIDTN